MRQAKRTTRKRSASPRRGLPRGFGMLIIGMMIGSLATILWQGMRLADSGVGTGIRKVVEQSLQQSRQDEQETSGQKNGKEDKPVVQKTSFDFFTVLPEIEMVVPDSPPPIPSPPPSTTSSAESGNVKSDPSAAIQAASKKSVYMLQAGSYQKINDANRLKAELALWGHASQIQKVTIQGRGDFFRVRLGPYSSYDEMVESDKSLASFGIKALRLKISGGG